MCCGDMFWQKKPVLSDEVKKSLHLYCLENLLPCLQKLHQEQREELKVERNVQGKAVTSALSICKKS